MADSSDEDSVVHRISLACCFSLVVLQVAMHPTIQMEVFRGSSNLNI